VQKAWELNLSKIFIIELGCFIIGGIPAFMLIDREQNFIDSRALLPSENVREVLYKLEGI